MNTFDSEDIEDIENWTSNSPGQKVGTKSFGFGKVFDVVDPVDARRQATVTTVGVESFVEVTDGNIAIALEIFCTPCINFLDSFYMLATYTGLKSKQVRK